MNEEKVRELINERLNNEPDFREKFNTFLKSRGVSGELSDDELSQVSGGFFGIETCPKCKNYTLTTFTFGVYASCTTEGCDYTEWFI